YFSEGFEGRLLVGSIARERSHEETMTDNDAILDGRFWAVDLDRRSSNTALQRQLDDTLTLLRRSDCVVYPIDIGGLKADGDVTVGAPVGRSHGEDALFAFAKGTGGELLRNGNDLGDQLRRVAEKTSLTYVLTFRPTKSAGEGKFHVLKVRVKTKGAHVSARAGYYETRIFRLAPGKYRIRSFVRDEERGRFAFQVVRLDVPEPAETRALRALPPLFFSAGGPGISLKDPAPATKPGSEPFELAGDLFIPQL